MTRLIASDFDGTLYFSDRPEHVSREDLAAIRDFQAEGGLFGACTGRPLVALTKDSAGLVPFDFYIAMSGATVFDRDMRPIFQHTLERDFVRETRERFLPYYDGAVDLLCAADDYWVIGSNNGYSVLEEASSFDDLPDPLYGFTMRFPTEEITAEMVVSFNESYSDVAVAYQNVTGMDVMPKGCSKGEGLRIAAGYYGATITGGIGDAANDIPLLDAVDVAYTFDYSHADVQDHAQVLVKSAAGAIRDFMSRG